MKKSALIVCAFLLLISCKRDKKESLSTEPNTDNSKDAATIAAIKEAYVYGFPLIIMDATKTVMTNVAKVSHVAAPINQLHNKNDFPDDTATEVVKPNCDTYYTVAWLDLSKDAMVLNAPNTNGRYYMLPLLDAWSNVFASPGKRTTGTEAKTFLITGPNWKGEVPKNMEQIKAPTNMVWLTGRTQVNSKEDGATTVKKIQDGYKIVPLSVYGKSYTSPVNQVNPSIKKQPPIEQVLNLTADDFFNKLNKLMVQNPPAAIDAPLLKKIKQFGIEPNGKFDSSKFSPAVQDSLKNIAVWFKKSMDKINVKGKAPINGWTINRGVGNYKDNYTLRAMVAMVGLGANLDADAIYPTSSLDADGDFLDGSKNKYTLHFEKNQIPPANAFWSLTMYGNDNFLVKNSINRFVLGDRNKMKYNTDGSLDIYIQKDSPGKEKEANWLPAPNGLFNLAIRIYWPKEEVLNGNWNPPGVKKTK